MRRSLRPNQYLRMIENRFVTTESAFIDMDEWDACVDPDAAPVLQDRNLPVWIGVDASVKHDSTAIAVVTFDRQAQRVILVGHRIFQPSAKQPLDFDATIARTVRELMKRFAVRGVFYDPFQMAAVAQRLQAAGVPMREFPQTVGNLTEIGSNLYELIRGRGLAVYRNAAVRLAVSRAIAIETPRGWRIAKEKAAHKIDVVVALAMAAHAAIQGSRVPEVSLAMPIVAGGMPHAVPGGSSLGYADAFVAPTSAQLDAVVAAAKAMPEPPPKPAPGKRKPGAPALTVDQKIELWRQKFAPNEAPWQPPGPNAPVKAKPEWLLKAQREITNADQSYRRNTNPPAPSTDNGSWRSFVTGGG